MNYQLMAADYLPVSIPVEQCQKYFETLEAYACEGELTDFADLIASLEEARLDLYITAIEHLKQSSENKD